MRKHSFGQARTSPRLLAHSTWENARFRVRAHLPLGGSQHASAAKNTGISLGQIHITIVFGLYQGLLSTVRRSRSIKGLQLLTGWIEIARKVAAPSERATATKPRLIALTARAIANALCASYVDSVGGPSRHGFRRKTTWPESQLNPSWKVSLPLV